MAQVVSTEGIDQILGALQAEGRTVIGPRVRDGVIGLHEVRGVADLPSGWADEQDGGRYRVVETGTPEFFASAAPALPWKRFLYPERTLLVRAHRSNGGQMVVETPEPEEPSVAFFGVRSCDLAALSVLDRVFMDDSATDPTYQRRRADAFVVAVGCNNPANTCFCVSMDTGPTPQAGYDLALRELLDPHRFVVEVGSDRGAAVMAQIESAEATRADLDASAAAHDQAAERMGRRLDPTHPPLAAAVPDDPRWDDVAERCLACGNCTMVCPTCFCSTTHDSTDLAGTTAERWRVWDSCFTLDFTHLHGGSVRTSTKSRYRQWLMHKLVTWVDQFDTSGCVGCGRCITWCPVGIDLTEEIAALAAAQTEVTR